MWSNKANSYTLQNYKYFNGVMALRGLQDRFAENLQSHFSVIQRGCVGSKSNHIDTKNWYSKINSNLKETDIETLQAKAAHEEMLKQKVNYMDKTLKSIEYFNKHDREENKRLKEENEILRKELEELKKNVLGIEKKEGLEQDQKKDIGTRRGFSGKRYGKSV